MNSFKHIETHCAGCLPFIALALLLIAWPARAAEPIRGVAGAPPGDMPKLVPWYTWGAHEMLSTWPPERAILHKMAHPDTQQPDFITALDREFEWIAEMAARDTYRERVWLCFSKPDLSNVVESGYHSRPRNAALVYYRFYWTIKRACPTCRVGGPNLYYASDEAIWTEPFLAFLAEINGPPAHFDIFAIHDWYGRYEGRESWGYDLRYTYRGMLAYLDQLDGWRARWPQLFPANMELWVTETGGPLWADTQKQTNEWAQALLASDVWGRVDRWYWFVAQSEIWETSCPATVLWTLNGEMTETGRMWLEHQPRHHVWLPLAVKSESRALER